MVSIKRNCALEFRFRWSATRTDGWGSARVIQRGEEQRNSSASTWCSLGLIDMVKIHWISSFGVWGIRDADRQCKRCFLAMATTTFACAVLRDLRSCECYDDRMRSSSSSIHSVFGQSGGYALMSRVPIRVIHTSMGFVIRMTESALNEIRF